MDGLEGLHVGRGRPLEAAGQRDSPELPAGHMLDGPRMVRGRRRVVVAGRLKSREARQHRLLGRPLRAVHLR
eukprot:CAMPEP_0179343358 /NCGR_PEP_ID=MMETSP0797-20121207/70923_1 /TAXON_ID=47934 /ORGANISM="Dinophysis acuminata, Strain DAEP01" /LENGTH=71 /DNA_ID=CAMNT_0021057685 /DNA_START=45 /DNA_END=257 /DNA_ORIENTATION=+